MTVSFNGFNEQAATFTTDAKITKHYPVKMAGNMKAAAAADGQAFIGFCLDSDAKHATVQLSGHVQTSYTGAAPAVGIAALASDGSGALKTVQTGGTNCLVLSVDTTSKIIDILF